MAGLFSGFAEKTFALDGVEIFARIGGEGPPLLLIHGYPQTGAMWHTIAAELASRYTCVIPDLRGYGGSSCPPNAPGNGPYSKRRMALDLIGVMAALGHERFLVAGHDRGGRVAYRMALDHPDRVAALAVLDIKPTHAMWHGMDHALAMKTYHWMMLAQPFPLPERLIGGDPRWYLDWTIASWSKAKNLSAYDSRALAEYRDSFAREANIHASCNDYRAGETFDLAADESDRAAGRTIVAPLLALWGSAGIPADGGASLLDIWRPWCSGALDGEAIDAGHFIVEENPSDTLAALMPFLERQRSLI